MPVIHVQPHSLLGRIALAAGMLLVLGLAMTLGLFLFLIALGLMAISLVVFALRACWPGKRAVRPKPGRPADAGRVIEGEVIPRERDAGANRASSHGGFRR